MIYHGHVICTYILNRNPHPRSKFEFECQSKYVLLYSWQSCTVKKASAAERHRNGGSGWCVPVWGFVWSYVWCLIRPAPTWINGDPCFRRRSSSRGELCSQPGGWTSFWCNSQRTQTSLLLQVGLFWIFFCSSNNWSLISFLYLSFFLFYVFFILISLISLI